MGATKAAAQIYRERIEPDQQLLALGASNLGAGLSGGYVVTGALSKTSVAMASGGRSQVGNLFAAVLGLLTILLLRPLFEGLALTALAALSLVILVYHVGSPPSTVLGRTTEGRWRDMERVEGAAQVDGLSVFRLEAPLVFLNARWLFERLRDLITEDIDVVVVDASVVSGVDTTGADGIHRVQRRTGGPRYPVVGGASANPDLGQGRGSGDAGRP